MGVESDTFQQISRAGILGEGPLSVIPVMVRLSANQTASSQEAAVRASPEQIGPAADIAAQRLIISYLAA